MNADLGPVGAVIMVAVYALGAYGAVQLFMKPPRHDQTRVGWGALSGVGLTVAIFILAQALGLAFLALVVQLTGQSGGDFMQELKDSTWAQFATVATVELLTLGLIYQMLRRRHTPARLIGWMRPKPRDIVYAIAGFAGYFVIYILVVLITRQLLPGLNVDQEQDIGYSTTTSGALLIPVFISLVVLPPLVEELLARGVLYTGLRTKLSFLQAGIITSVLFAVAHLPGSVDGAPLWIGAIDTFVLSMVLVTVREKTGSLWPCIGIHALKNGLAFMSLFVFHMQ